MRSHRAATALPGSRTRCGPYFSLAESLKSSISCSAIQVTLIVGFSVTVAGWMGFASGGRVMIDGVSVGCELGHAVVGTDVVGRAVGFPVVGDALGSNEGVRDGTTDGLSVGVNVGSCDGCRVGYRDGSCVGSRDGG